MLLSSKPTLKTLLALNITEPKARELHKVIQLIGSDSHDDIDSVLDKANELLGGHGIESIRNAKLWTRYYTDTALLYVNMGDTYAVTFCYDIRAGRFSVCSIGWWIENEEAQGRYQEP